MKALTLHGVHAWCVMHAGKYVENRSWLPSPELVGQRFAIHAGQNPGHAEAREWVNREYPTSPKNFPKGVILGTVLLKVVVGKTSETEIGFFGVTEKEVDSALASVWAGDSEAWWILDDPRPLSQPIPCKGALQLWNVPDEFLEQLAIADSTKGAKSRRPIQTERAEVAPPRTTQSKPAERPARSSAVDSRTIDEVPSEEVLAVLCAMATSEPRNEQDLLRSASRRLGFARMGARVEQRLRAQLDSAVKLKILERNNDGVRVA